MQAVSGGRFARRLTEAAGGGRASLRVWPRVRLGVVIKRTAKQCVGAITRQLMQGTPEHAQARLSASSGGTVLTPAIALRLHGTRRQRLASLTRTGRQAARRRAALASGLWRLGCTSNFCWPHHELSQRVGKVQGGRGAVLLTQALACDLIDHLWSIQELLSSRMAPLPWMELKRRGRPKKLAASEASNQALPRLPPRLRPLLRLRKGVFCSTTSEWSPAVNARSF